jgi:hypothetical protein
MLSAGRVSQRKLNEPDPPLALLESNLRECTERLAPLMEESHVWSHVQPDVPQIPSFPSESGDPDDEIDEITDDIWRYVEFTDQVSLELQGKRKRLRELQNLCDDLYREFQGELAIDFREQARICRIMESG